MIALHTSRRMKKWRVPSIALLSAILMISGSGMANAQCANPVGAAGEQIYNTDFSVMQYCDGTDWTAMRGGVAADSIDWDDITDTMTLDATTTIDMDTNAGDLIFDTNTFVIDSSANRIGIGTSTPDAMLTMVGQDFNTNFNQDAHGNNQYHAVYNFLRRARGTIATPLAVQNADEIGEFNFWGYDGDSYESSAAIAVTVNGAVVDGFVPADMTFNTSNSGVLTERMRIDSTGGIGIGTLGTADASALLEVTSADRGFLAPRVSDPTSAIAAPATGLIAYNTVTDLYEYYDGTAWRTMGYGSGGGGFINDLGDAATDYVTDFNMFMGDNAGASIAVGGQYNLAIGQNAGDAITTGDSNTVIGYGAGTTLTTTNGNTLIGANAGYNVNPDGVTAIGQNAGYNAGSYSTYLGYIAGTVGTSSNSVYLGAYAGERATGNDNVAVGYDAYNFGSGADNVAIGRGAGYGVLATTTAANSVFIGRDAGTAITTGDANNLIGYQAGDALTTGTSNIALGSNALGSATTADYNLAIGNLSMRDNVDGYRNISIGDLSMASFNSDFENVVIGYGAYENSTGGTRNVILGDSAMQASTGSSNNVAIGDNVLQNATGGNHVVIGQGAGSTITTGTDNILLGYGVDVSAAGASFEMNIGDTIYGDLSTGRLGIGVADATAIDTDAILELNASDKGFLAPRVSDPATAIGTPAIGMMAYDTATSNYKYYDGAAWQDFGFGVGGDNLGDHTTTQDITFDTTTRAIVNSTSNLSIFFRDGHPTHGLIVQNSSANDLVGITLKAPGAERTLRLENRVVDTESGTAPELQFANNPTNNFGIPGFIISDNVVGVINGTSLSVGTATPDSSAILQADSTDRGFLAPRVSDPTSAIAAPATGLIAYNTVTDLYEYYDGTSWVNFNAGGTGLFTDNTTHITRENFHVLDAGLAAGSTTAGLDGDGTYSFYDPDKSAFRGGTISGGNNAWQDVNIGNNNIAWGENVANSGNNGIVIGLNSTVSGNEALAVGRGINITATRAVGLGNEVSISGYSSFGFGGGNGSGRGVSGDNSFVAYVGGDAAGIDVSSDNTAAFIYGTQTALAYNSPESFAVLGGSMVIDTATPSGNGGPNVSAALDLTSTDKGFLAPRVSDPTSTIAAPATGLMAYNTVTDLYEFYDGTSWVNFNAGGTGLFTDNTTHITRENFHVLDAGLAAGSTTASLDGDGTRTFYDPDKGAFRGGTISGGNNAWQDANIGVNSFAWGENAEASGAESFAFGDDVTANGDFNIAIGNVVVSSGYASFAQGVVSSATGINSIAMGENANSTNHASLALGSHTNVSGQNSFSLGVRGDVSGQGSGALNAGTAGGVNPIVSADQTIAMFLGNQSGSDVTGTNIFAVLGEAIVVTDAGAGTTVTAPTSAIAQFDSTDKGFLAPRVSDPTSAITTPATGLMAYNTVTDLYQFYDGTSWVNFGASGGVSELNDLSDAETTWGGATIGTSGTGSMVIGEGAAGNASGAFNGSLAVGFQAAQNNTSAAASVYIGNWAGRNAGGSSTTYIGVEAGRDSPGYHGVAVGTYSGLQSNNDFTAVGWSALRYNTASRNTALGSGALTGVSGSSTGGTNVAVGFNAGTGVTTGSANTLLGNQAGNIITTGARNIMIGRDTDPSAATVNDELNIGDTLFGNLANNQIAVNVTDASAIEASAILQADSTDRGFLPPRMSDPDGDITGEVEGLVAYDLVDNELQFYDGTSWISTSGGGGFIDDLGDATTDYVTTFNMFMGDGAGGGTGSENLAIGQDTLGSLTTGFRNTGVGLGAMQAVSTQTNNVAMGVNAGRNFGGNFNVAVGNYAGQGVFPTTTAANSVFIGHNAGTAITTGDDNTLVGYQTGDALTTGGSNVAIGNNSLSTATVSSDNVAIGTGALDVYNSATAGSMIAIGSNALGSATDGRQSIAIGQDALGSWDSAPSNSDNTAVGNAALLFMSTGQYNVAMGSDAGRNLDNSSANVFIGNVAGEGTTSSQDSINDNTIIGYYAGQGLETGAQRNTVLGNGAGAASIVNGIGAGTDNILIGYRTDVSANGASNELNIGGALFGNLANNQIAVNVTDASAIEASAILQADSTDRGFLAPRVSDPNSAIAAPATGLIAYNTATDLYEFYDGTAWRTMGYGSGGGGFIDDLGDATTDYVTDFNMFMGENAGASILAGGQHNIAIGQNAGDAITTGDNNIAIGYDAGTAITTGGSNTTVGYSSLVNLTDGVRNAAFGRKAGSSITSGDENTIIGDASMEFGVDGSNNTTLGHGAMFFTGGSENTAVGRGALGGSVISSTINNNTALGTHSGSNITTGGNNNLFLGWQAGDVITTGSGNIIIGYDVDATSATASNELNIGNTIYGDLAAGNVGIGTASPASELQVIGDVQVSNFVKYDGVAGNAPTYDIPAIALNDLTDVVVPAPSNNDVLTWTGANWVAQAASGGGFIDDLGDATTDYVTDFNMFMGENAGANTPVGAQYNIAIGQNAFNDAGKTNLADYNVAIGRNSGTAITTGGSNIMIGYDALASGTTAFETVAIGQEALSNSGGGADGVVAIGMFAARNAGTDYNVGVGAFALENGGGVAGEKVAIGAFALRNTDGGANVAIGRDAGTGVFGSSTAENSVFVGTRSGTAITTGNNNTLVGYQTGDALTTGGSNVAMGINALGAATDADNNVAIGLNAAALNTSHNGMIAIGANAADAYAASIGAPNVIIGQNSYTNATAGAAVTTLGVGTFETATNGSDSVAIGNYTFGAISTTSHNTGVGSFVAPYLRNGTRNTMMGSEAGQGNGTDFSYDGSDNVFIGYRASYGLDNTNDRNTFVGTSTGVSLTGGGSDNILLGYGVDVSGAAVSNELNIGDALFGNLTNNQIAVNVADASAIAASAILQADSTNRGFLAPRVSDPSVAIAAPATGLIAYNTVTDLYQFYDGTAWRDFGFGVGGGFLDDLGDAATTIADQNMFIGHEGGSYGPNDNNNLGIGYGALDSLNNDPTPFEGDDNTAIGHNALTANNAGRQNTAVGTNTLLANTSGRSNSALGFNSLGANISGVENTVIGRRALYTNETGDFNTVLGSRAGYGLPSLSDVSNNIFIGQTAAYNVLTGADSNTIIGQAAAPTLTTGSSNIIIGQGADVSAAATSNELNIGGTIFGDLSTDRIGVGVADATAIDASALVEFDSADKGFLAPRVSDPNGDIASPATGLIAYDLADNELQFYNGTAWTSAGGTGLWTDNTTHVTRESFHVLDAGLAAGSTTAGLDGDGTYSFYDPDKGAFRGGTISGGSDAWQDANIGVNSFAWGDNAKATGVGAIALGSQLFGMDPAPVASGDYSFAVGNSTTASGFGSFVAGQTSSASGDISFGLGTQAHASGEQSMSIGKFVSTSGYSSLALGNNVRAGNGTATTLSDSGIAGRGNFSMAFGVGGSAATYPQVTGNESAAFFFGDQTGEDITATNVLALEGGSLLLSNDSGTACDAAKQGALRLNASATGLEMCDGAGTWGGFGTAQAIDDLTDAATDYVTDFNMFMGQNAGASIAAGGQRNIAIGQNAGDAITTGDNNIAIGYDALTTASTGSLNIAIGLEALEDTTGGENVAVGPQALANNTTGERNQAIGYQAMFSNQGGAYNNVLGAFALMDNQSGSRNVAIGDLAGSGTSVPTNVSNNVFIGHNAGLNVQTGANNNVFLGYQAGNLTTTGTDNIIIGYDVDPSGATASDELNIGDLIYGDLAGGEVGINIAAPVFEMHVHDSASGAGAESALLLTTGDTGAAATDGFQLGYANVAGTQFGTVWMHENQFMNFATNNTERMRIAANGDIGINNTAPDVELDVTGDIEYTGTITDVSDVRLKTDIHTLSTEDMIEKIAQIDTYSFKMKGDEKGRVEMGVMAQDLEKIFPELVKTAKDEIGTKSVNYMGLIAPMIEATKALNEQNKALSVEMASLQSDRAQTQASLESLNKQVTLLNKAYLQNNMKEASFAPQNIWLMLLLGFIGGGGFMYFLARRPLPKS